MTNHEDSSKLNLSFPSILT